MPNEWSVNWSEGLFLTPHHLQQTARHHEATLAQRFRTLVPFGSGFTGLTIKRETLANGKLSIETAEGILPDGRFFSIPDFTPPPPDVTIAGRFPSDLDTLPAWLGIRAPRGDRAQTVLAGTEDSRTEARYRIEPIRVRDENTGDNERELLVRRDIFRILLPDDPLGEYEYLPIGFLVRTPEGGFQMRPEYVPPCLWLSASNRLLGHVVRIHESLLAMSTEQTGRRRESAPGIVDYSRDETSPYGMLRTINRYIPILAHARKHSRIHPERVYRWLIQLAGELSAIADLPVTKLPPYEHDDLETTFETLAVKIPEMMKVLPDQLLQIPLESKDNIFFRGQIMNDRFLQAGTTFFLAVRADEDQRTLIDQIPLQVKVASAEAIERTVFAALPGVGKNHVPMPPGALMAKSSYVYFKLEAFGPDWDSIRGSRSISVYVPDIYKGLRVELMALREG
jgi:type VI secretion system protein ImpJ